MADKALRDAKEQIESQNTPTPVVKSFFDEQTYTASYVVHDPDTKQAAIIDSVLGFDAPSGRTSYDGADAIIAYVTEKDLTVAWILETHAHADHLTAAPYLKSILDGQIGIGREIKNVQNVFGELFNFDSSVPRDGSQFDHLFADGEQFQIGTLPVSVLHVPGHTPADLAYVIGDVAFVGDTIFMPDYGTARADFPGGDAGTLFDSIRRLLSLPRHTKLFLCHDYKAPGRDQFVWETTVAAERQFNIHVHDGISKDGFVAMREARDKTLDMPTLILPSIQVNIWAGHLPEPESNGTRYFKIPLDVI